MQDKLCGIFEGMSKVIRRKRSDTLVKTIEKKYGVDFLVKTIEKKYGVDLGYRSDAQLHSVLKSEGLPSLSTLLKMTQQKTRRSRR